MAKTDVPGGILALTRSSTPGYDLASLQDARGVAAADATRAAGSVSEGIV